MAKKYTRAQWARQQSRLPEEDRVPYENSPDKLPSPSEDPYYVRDPKTGLSPAQVEANKAVAEAAKATGQQIVPGEPGLANKVFTPYEMGSTEYLGKTYSTAAGAYTAAVETAEKVGPPGPAPEGLHWNLQGTVWKLYDKDGKPFNYLGSSGEGFTGSGNSGDPLLYNGKPFNGIRGGVTYVNGFPKGSSGGNKTETGRVTNPDGSITITYSDGSTIIIPAQGGDGGAGGDGSTGGAGGDGDYTPTPTPTLAKDTFKTTLGLFFGTGEINKPWVDQLYNVVSKYYKTGSTIDESLNLALQDARKNPALSEFTRRFKGIYALQDMRQAGKPVTVPTIAEYVASQAALADILVGSGLRDLATEDFTGDLLGKGLSVSTVGDRIAKAYDRIDRAPKAIKDTLSRYFPTLDRSMLAKTLLLGEKGTKQLVDELAGYEVLSAAEQQGIAATGSLARTGGVTTERAQEYARMGYTYENILPEFGKIAQATPTVSKLAGISGREDIGQVGIEQAVLNKNVTQAQELARLTAEEEARFAGKVGRAELGLASQRRANRAF